MPLFRNIIFDWSGTLCDDLDLTIEATNYVLSRCGRAPLTREQFRAEFQLPYPEYYAWKTPEVPLERLEDYFRYSFARSTVGVTRIPHAAEFLEFCKRRGIRLFTLTSMDPAAFVDQSKELGFHEYFEHIHSGIHNKEDYIPTLMRMHALNPAETAFVGDMQHDMAAAHRAGVTAIGVLTGYNDANQLSQARPDIMLPDLAALQALLERTNAADTIRINGLELPCHIGWLDDERASLQTLKADISMRAPVPFSECAEDLSNTIDYDAVARRLTALAAAEPVKLVETLAHRLATACVQEFGAPSATVTLYKYILPDTDSVAVSTTVSAP
ncbi:MAG: HAD hydrolase-like protein [Akkermansia sp.]|nr:HAD hydrolase-like protein [Akkermansia sp.]